ncbi:MAG: hypothetical protein R3C28_02690 [Pirellulaceae bacterium]
MEDINQLQERGIPITSDLAAIWRQVPETRKLCGNIIEIRLIGYRRSDSRLAYWWQAIVCTIDGIASRNVHWCTGSNFSDELEQFSIAFGDLLIQVFSLEDSLRDGSGALAVVTELLKSINKYLKESKEKRKRLAWCVPSIARYCESASRLDGRCQGQ